MNKLILATETGANFQALYLNGRLIGDLGDNLTAHIDTSFETPTDILENLFSQPEFDGIEFVQEYRHQKGIKTWTDYGWEYDAEWPENYEETHPVDPSWYTYTPTESTPDDTSGEF